MGGGSRKAVRINACSLFLAMFLLPLAFSCDKL